MILLFIVLSVKFSFLSAFYEVLIKRGHGAEAFHNLFNALHGIVDVFFGSLMT